MTLIWAYDTEDPFSSPDQLEVSGFPSWHGTTVTQGSQLYVHMRLPNQPLPFPDGDDGLGTPPTDVKVWDLTLENVATQFYMHTYTRFMPRDICQVACI